jgi:glycosyltransferase involved in cell wall biosynthesis
MFSVLAFTVKPFESPDSRYRILQYCGLAAGDGIRIDHRTLMGPKYFRWQTQNEQLLLRLLLYPCAVAVRLWQVLFLAPKYDAVWVLREMAPLGPGILERLLLWRCKRVILDVDDALHVSDKASSRLIPRLLRDRGKFGDMAASYTAVICGSRYLADFYSQHGASVNIIPTVVDAERYATIRRIPSEVTRIGWIGTPLNEHRLEMLYPALSALARERRFELVIVGLGKTLNWDLPGIRFMQWNLEDELKFFAHFDIGIMPLDDSPFARGKCAFKLIQYMAAGLPVVASPVGANCEVVTHGRNGFLASAPEDWHSALRLLIDDPALRRRMGENGRDLVRRSYSMRGVWPSYSTILTGVRREGAVCAAV